ncbi:MAG: hypothetical protein R2862_06020 [Thermoanaerobaculia bacterium]
MTTGRKEPGRETLDHLATLAGGHGFPGWMNLLPLLASRTRTLELLPDALWVALDPPTLLREVEHHAGDLHGEFEARREHRRFALEPEILEHSAAAVRSLVEGAAADPAARRRSGGGRLRGAGDRALPRTLPRFPPGGRGEPVAVERVLLVAPAQERHAAPRQAPQGAARSPSVPRGSSSSAARSSADSACRRRGSPSMARRSSCRVWRRAWHAGRGRFGPFLATLRDLKVDDVVHADAASDSSWRCDR